MLRPIPDFFDYEVIIHPLHNEDSRVFQISDSNKVCYRAYKLALARHGVTKSLALLIEHGAGREIMEIESSWIAGEPLIALCQSNERAGYAILFSMYKSAGEAARKAKAETAEIYRRAFVENRLKKRKARQSNAYKVWIEAPKFDLVQSA